MSNSEVEYSYSDWIGDGYDVTVEIRVRYNPDRVVISYADLDVAGQDAVESVRVTAVQEINDEGD